MGLGESFDALFSSANILTVCLWVGGIILFSIEFFQPMHKMSFSLGALLLVAAFVTRVIIGSPGEGFAFILMTCLMLYAFHLLSIVTQKRDWLKVSRLERAGEVKSRKLGSLVGKTGVAITVIDMTGSVNVDDVNLAVYSETPIAVGQRVRITRVSNDRITVEPID